MNAVKRREGGHVVGRNAEWREDRKEEEGAEISLLSVTFPDPNRASFFAPSLR